MGKLKKTLSITLTLALCLGLTWTGLEVYQDYRNMASYTPDPSPSDLSELTVEIHLDMWHWRDGELLEYSHHAGTLTNIGADWIEDQLGDSPSTDPAKWIAVSNSTDSPSAAWEVLPAEISGNGMSRAAGTYASTGTGTWNETLTFSPTASGDCRLAGLYYAAAGNFLLASDTFTVISYESGDSIQLTFMVSVS